MQQEIEIIGTTRKDIADMVGLSSQALQDIAAGKRALSQVETEVFERKTGVPADMWLGLERKATDRRLK